MSSLSNPSIIFQHSLDFANESMTNPTRKPNALRNFARHVLTQTFVWHSNGKTSFSQRKVTGIQEHIAKKQNKRGSILVEGSFLENL